MKMLCEPTKPRWLQHLGVLPRISNIRSKAAGYTMFLYLLVPCTVFLFEVEQNSFNPRDLFVSRLD